MGDRSQHFIAIAIFVIMCMLGSCLNGCGGAPRAVRSGLAVTAHELVVVDQAAATRYTAAADAALDASTTMDEYRGRMARWDRVESALRSTRSALIVAERAVDTWDASENGSRAALGCLADALQLLADALVEAGIPIPEKLLQVVSLGSTVLGTCQVEVTP